MMPKEQEVLDICLEEKAKGRKVLTYCTYTGTRGTTARLKVAGASGIEGGNFAQQC